MLSPLVRPPALALLVALSTAVAAFAQTGGTIEGGVRDDQGKPIAGARVTLDQLEGEGRRADATSDGQGAFVVREIAPGNYRISAFKNHFVTGAYEVLVRAGRTARVNFALAAGAAEPLEATLLADDRAAPGVRGRSGRGGGRRSGHRDPEIPRSDRPRPALLRLLLQPRHRAGAEADRYADAEAAFKKALELRPDAPEARRSLANALYNLGVSEWNAGRVPAARQRFEAAVEADPERADAHYRLGMTLVNAGELARAAAEFETYLHLAPDGPNASQAREHLLQLKKKPR